MNSREIRSLQEAYMEVIKNQQLSDDELDYIVEGFKDLTPEKEERVRSALPRIIRKAGYHHDQAQKNAKEVINRREGRGPIAIAKGILVGTAGPARRGREHVAQSRKYIQHIKNAQDALSRTQASRDASNIYKRNKLRKKIRNLGGNPDNISASSNIRKFFRREEVDFYDIILSHLLDEGYANTPEAAEAIMVNMSEGWVQSIIG